MLYMWFYTLSVICLVVTLSLFLYQLTKEKSIIVSEQSNKELKFQMILARERTQVMVLIHLFLKMCNSCWRVEKYITHFLEKPDHIGLTGEN